MRYWRYGISSGKSSAKSWPTIARIASTANAGSSAISVSVTGRNFARQLLRAPSAPNALQRASEMTANHGARRIPS